MARVILKIIKSGSKDIDHINRNTFDNRKCNLRLVSHSINCINRRKRINTKSKYRGVCWDKISQKWRAIIRNQRGIRTSDEILAATQADDFMILQYGENALPNLNFPLVII